MIRSHIAPHPPVPIVGAGTLSSALTGPKAPPLYHHAYPLSLPLSRESLRLTGHPIFIRHHTLNRPRARVVFQCAYSDILRRVPPSELSLLSYFSQPPRPNLPLLCARTRDPPHLTREEEGDSEAQKDNAERLKESTLRGQYKFLLHQPPVVSSNVHFLSLCTHTQSRTRTELFNSTLPIALLHTLTSHHSSRSLQCKCVRAR